MNTHLPSFIISETPNGVLYGLGYSYYPRRCRGLLAATPNGVDLEWRFFYSSGVAYSRGNGAGLLALSNRLSCYTQITDSPQMSYQRRHT